MIKRIIFDIDNTLIDWDNKNYFYAVTSACEKNGIKYSTEIECKIKKVIDSYEEIEEFYDKEKMHHLICKELGKQYSRDFTEEILGFFATCIPEKIGNTIIETLEYLKTKYEIVALTNWFEKEQGERLKKAKIDKYFKNIYGTEKIKIKPNREAFIFACGEHLTEECVMIGDNFKVDIQGALDAGLNAIFLNKKGIKTTVNINSGKIYREINHLRELMKIL